LKEYTITQLHITTSVLLWVRNKCKLGPSLYTLLSIPWLPAEIASGRQGTLMHYRTHLEHRGREWGTWRSGLRKNYMYAGSCMQQQASMNYKLA
jgi:hypothetical protein